ncbi:MAG: hypothetical protein NTV82_03050, partial [Candidatus Aminicenantes bacterium]|nr:hypothetical protein [Candidatus Aminicenantes bacterium]
QLLRLGISLLSIFCFLNYWTACKPEIQTVPVAIGEARIVGRLQAGTVTLQPGTDTAGDFLIVTKALWYETYKLAWKVRALELEIEMLKAKDKK